MLQVPSTQPSMRVVEAWEAGYSGKGVSVTILDDGIEYEHPDLKENYVRLSSLPHRFLALCTCVDQLG